VGKGFGDAADPRLVSVRSGAQVSMPGMMDTVLNLRLNDATKQGLVAISGNAGFAWDGCHRFIQMYSDVVLGLDHHLFEHALEIAKEDNGFHVDVETEAAHWQALVGTHTAIVERAGQALSAGPDRAAAGWDCRSVRFVGFGPGEGLLPAQRHPG